MQIPSPNLSDPPPPPPRLEPTNFGDGAPDKKYIGGDHQMDFCRSSFASLSLLKKMTDLEPLRRRRRRKGRLWNIRLAGPLLTWRSRIGQNCPPITTLANPQSFISETDAKTNNLDANEEIQSAKLQLRSPIDEKIEAFRQFDVVEDHSDHHYNSEGVSLPAKSWAKRIVYEWDILAKNLPESIYVRVYEDRMDILRAVIKGPAGTPYSDGLFLFDVLFPHDYPSSPPLVHYHSRGLWLNPNLYKNGTVCLSLLGTWIGGGCEKWCPSKSTMLQVLVSIQGLILNSKPFFNEPGFAPLEGTSVGEKMALAYNKNIFLVSCKMMLYSMRKPPRHFEVLVDEHFRERGCAILRACRCYLAGAEPGCSAGSQELSDVGVKKKCWFLSFWTRFRKTFSKVLPSSLENQMQKLYNDLSEEFASKGAYRTEFLPQ